MGEKRAADFQAESADMPDRTGPDRATRRARCARTTPDQALAQRAATSDRRRGANCNRAVQRTLKEPEPGAEPEQILDTYLI